MVKTINSSIDFNKKSIFFKIHLTFEKKIIAFADQELIGQTFKDKEKKISINVKPEFYQGEKISLSEGLDLLRSYPNCNIVGSLAYHAVKNGLAHKHSLLWIIDKEKKMRIPHLLLIRL